MLNTFASNATFLFLKSISSIATSPLPFFIPTIDIVQKKEIITYQARFGNKQMM